MHFIFFLLIERSLDVNEMRMNCSLQQAFNVMLNWNCEDGELIRATLLGKRKSMITAVVVDTDTYELFPPASPPFSPAEQMAAISKPQDDNSCKDDGNEADTR